MRGNVVADQPIRVRETQVDTAERGLGTPDCVVDDGRFAVLFETDTAVEAKSGCEQIGVIINNDVVTDRPFPMTDVAANAFTAAKACRRGIDTGGS